MSMTYTRTKDGHYTARAFGEVITAHSKEQLKRGLELAERRAQQREWIRRNAPDRRFT